MKYFIIDLMPAVDMEYCVLEYAPEGTQDLSHRMSRGMPMGADYPLTPKWQMSEEFGGIKLPSLMANTSSMLIVDRKLKEIFERVKVPIECLPFVLCNHKGRAASQDYYIINPLGSFDCLHLEQSDVVRSVNGIVRIKKHVLDPGKTESAPDLFRITEAPEVIVISHRLADELKTVNPTNVYLHEVEQAPAPGLSGG
jgi:hypothetical protein